MDWTIEKRGRQKKKMKKLVTIEEEEEGETALDSSSTFHSILNECQEVALHAVAARPF